MSHRKLFSKKLSSGFTQVELLVVMVVIGVLSIAFVTFFSTSTNQYLALHQDSTAIGNLALQSQRIASVLRGSTDIISAANNEISVYSYFYPNDQFVSQVRYYKNPEGNKLFADVTPMTANPPIGTPIPAQMKTYTISSNFYSMPGVNTFEYLDSANATMALPIADLHTVKGIRITLAEPFTTTIATGENPMTLVVSLRNRKTNL